MRTAEDFMDLLEPMEESALSTTSKVEKAFNTLLKRCSIPDIMVEAERDGDNWIVSLTDEEGDTETIVFGVDEEIPYAIVVGDQEDTEEGNITEFGDLPGSMKNGVVNLENLSWLTKDVFLSLLSSDDSDVQEKFKIIIRDGKKIKKKIRIGRKKKRSPKQKAALKKAQRKAHTGSAAKKRAKSMKKRKAANL